MSGGVGRTGETGETRELRGNERWLALLGVAVAGISGCTEPNPYLPVASSGETTATVSSTGSPTAVDSSTTTTTGIGSSSSGDPPSECAQMGMECVDLAPEGWEGPFAWLERPERFEPVPCPAPYDEQLLEAFSDISAPAADCTCSCFDAVGMGCGEGFVERWSSTDCTGAVLNSQALIPGCQGTGAWAPGGGYHFISPEVVGGECQPLLDVSVQDASFLTRHRACAAELSGLDCAAGQVCAPAAQDPLYGQLCIWQDGDVPCPEGSIYSEHQRLFRSIDDARGCNPCSCDAPTGICEGATLSLHDSMGCGAPFPVPADGCTPGPGMVVSLMFHISGEPRGECEPSVPVPTGDATGAEPLTFCCMP